MALPKRCCIAKTDEILGNSEKLFYLPCSVLLKKMGQSGGQKTFRRYENGKKKNWVEMEEF